MFALIGLIPPWLAARRVGLQTVLAGSSSAGAVAEVGPQDRQPRDGKRTDGQSSEGKRAHGKRTHGYRRYAHRRWFQLVSLIKPGRRRGSRTIQFFQIMFCRIRELGGANARPNAEALGKRPIKKKPV